MKLLKSKEVAERVDVCYDHFRKVVKHDPKFPAPIFTHTKARPKWRDTEIDDYLNKKAA